MTQHLPGDVPNFDAPLVDDDLPNDLTPNEPTKAPIEDLDATPSSQAPGLIEDSPEQLGTLDTEDLNRTETVNFLDNIQAHPLVIKYTQEMPTVHQQAPMFIKDKPFDENQETLNLTSMPVADFTSVLETIPKDILEDSSPDSIDWLRTFSNSLKSAPVGNAYADLFARPSSQWMQSIPTPAGNLHMANVRSSNRSNTGAAASFMVGELFGRGGRVQIPLWHSGFWLTVECPSESALIDFEDRFLSERVAAARNTYGRVFSNQRSFFAHHVLELILSHVSQTNLKVDISELRDMIRLPDLNLLAHGFAKLIWPNGWQYSRARFGKTKLQEVVKQRTDIGRMLLTDYSAFNEHQLAHMAKRRSSVSVEEIRHYQAQFLSSAGRQIDMADYGIETNAPVRFNLRIPTVAEYVNTGMGWINDLVAMYDSFPTKAGGDVARSRYVADRMSATLLRQYEHFIESIEADDQVITDRSTITATLNQLSGVDRLREVLTEQTERFITDSTVSMVGIPTDDETEASAKYPRFPNTIPLDPLYMFFTQLEQKTKLIRNR